MIELLVAMVFFIVVSSFAIKIHGHFLIYSRTALDVLQQQLAMENLAERLNAISDEQLSSEAMRLTDGTDLEVKIAEFETGSSKGLHLTIATKATDNPSESLSAPRLQHHHWRLEAK
ncbi:hypothetical protein LOC67_10005 [Stieleria sp. JC731]|uniref:hypothetical protein n=1 Tax=Pirellulaceae TaxID=2691357 RepID=UPI001E33FFC4|nr:hypothetical protein [Stieleria sp. JC731]MCC9600900.1 hypothetical protein [Stieleria sp. JC731]